MDEIVIKVVSSKHNRLLGITGLIKRVSCLQGNIKAFIFDYTTFA